METRVLGPEDPHTVTARLNLATWTAAAGDPAAARDLLHRAGAGGGARSLARSTLKP